MNSDLQKRVFGTIGAGIAGLSASILVAKLGMRTHIFEKRSNEEVGGVGIQLTPNALRSLVPLNVLDDLISESYTPERLIVNDAHLSGEVSSLKLKDIMNKKFGFPYLTSSRSLLHKILLTRASRDPLIEISFNSNIVSINDNDDVICKSSNGKSFSFKNVLICNGIKNTLINDHSIKRHASPASWVLRTCLSGKDLPNNVLKNINLWMGKRFHVVSYPINKKLDINVVLVKRSSIPHMVMKEPNNDLSHLRSLNIENKNLIYLLSNVRTWSVWPLYQTKIIKRAKTIYSQNTLCLGDAGHPLYPHLAQGAALALEDSYTLYKLLYKYSDDNFNISEVFEKFAKFRIHRYQRMQIESRLNGIVFQQQGVLRLMRNLFIKNYGSSLLEKNWIYENKSISHI